MRRKWSRSARRRPAGPGRLPSQHGLLPLKCLMARLPRVSTSIKRGCRNLLSKRASSSRSQTEVSAPVMIYSSSGMFAAADLDRVPLGLRLRLIRAGLPGSSTAWQKTVQPLLSTIPEPERVVAAVCCTARDRAPPGIESQRGARCNPEDARRSPRPGGRTGRLFSP